MGKYVYAFLKCLWKFNKTKKQQKHVERDTCCISVVSFSKNWQMLIVENFRMGLIGIHQRKQLKWYPENLITAGTSQRTNIHSKGARRLLLTITASQCARWQLKPPRSLTAEFMLDYTVQQSASARLTPRSSVCRPLKRCQTDMSYSEHSETINHRPQSSCEAATCPT